MKNEVIRCWYKLLGRGRIPPFKPGLILHFSYHKCLTAYYSTVMTRLSIKHGFFYRHFNSDYDSLLKVLASGSARQAYSINKRSDIDLGGFGDFRGSHFIRDPRDLVVSGYHYHLWTHEPWSQKPDFNFNWITSNHFFKYISEDGAKPQGSYQQYLNSLDKEKGLILEMLRCRGIFKAMREWNYDHPDMLEMRYEDIIDNEVESFRKLFEHYGFSKDAMKSGLRIADRHSLKNKDRGDRKHTRSGKTGQWSDEFTPLVKKIFKQVNGDLLIKLGYEKDLNW